MQVNSIGNQMITSRHQNSKQPNFKAKLILHRNLEPYLREQASNIERNLGSGKGQAWFELAVNNLTKLEKRVKGILLPDTPLVIAANDDALAYVKKYSNIYQGKEAYMVMDGRPAMVNPEHMKLAMDSTRPYSFTFDPQGKFVDELVDRFRKIPNVVAQYFKPW